MYNLRQLRSTLEARIREANGNRAAGGRRWVEEIYEAVGLRQHDEATGELIESTDDSGRRVLAKNRVKPNEFSLQEMAVAIGGLEFLESFRPGGDGRSDALELIEAGPAVDPTAFVNVNLFNAATAGLIEARVLESLPNAKYIGDELFEVVPTRKNGEKIPGTAGFASTDGDNTRKPGEVHARAQYGERWVETPELEEKALACEVTQEAVFYDYTNEVLKCAGDVGEILGYGREKTMLRLFSGAANSYVYNGTAYNTYQTATPWINDFSNPAATYADVDESLEKFEDFTDPETGREILVAPDTIVHMPRKDSLWHFILNSMENRETSSNTMMLASAPPSTNGLKRLFSTILRNIIDNELGVSKAQAQDWWYHGQAKKGFQWMEAWPLRVRQASPTEFTMLDRGLVAAYFANYRGVGAVTEPRFWVRNKN